MALLGKDQRLTNQLTSLRFLIEYIFLWLSVVGFKAVVFFVSFFIISVLVLFFSEIGRAGMYARPQGGAALKRISGAPTPGHVELQ